MSEFRFACPHCGQRITGDAAYKGTEIQCPACRQSFHVPNPVPNRASPISLGGAARTAGITDTTRISPLALISIVASFGLGLGGIVGIVCGHLAERQIRRDPTLRGARLATLGLVMSYASVVFAIALIAVGVFVLGPRRGHQLTTAEEQADTPTTLAARRVDEVKINDPGSESEHHLRARFSTSGMFNNRNLRDARNGGAISYEMKVDPAEPMVLDCTYWGNDSGGRRFDILVNNEVIATENLDYNDPGHFFHVEYPIPPKLTRGRSSVTVVFQAYPQNTAGGLFGLEMLRRQ